VLALSAHLKKSFQLAVAATAICFACAVHAESIDLPRNDSEADIDGVLGNQEWRDADQVELSYEVNPGENIAASVKTIGYLMEDGTHLYVGFAASDPDPSAIRAYLRDRDSAYAD
jgi:hypothetical protein